MKIDVPGVGLLDVRQLVFNYNGTIARDGNLLSNIDKTFADLAAHFAIHVLTADTYGTAEKELAGLPCLVKVLQGEQTALQKLRYVRSLGPEQVVCIGNAADDQLMFKEARLSIAVLEGEGIAVGVIQHADILVRSIYDALGLLMIPQRIIATLRA
jgi:soluble P-type ATPase